MTLSVKFGVIEVTPLVTLCALDPICPRRGWAMDSALMICETLRWNCTFEWSNSSDFGDVDENGTATGMIAAIKDGLYDTSPPVYTPTYRRSTAIDFAKIYFTFDTVLTTRASKSDALNEIDWSLMKAFDWTVWCSFAVFLLVVSLLITGSTIKDAKYGPLNAYFDWAIRLVKYDSEPYLLQPTHIRMCYGAWVLGGLILTSSYTGMLFTEKVLQNGDVPFTDLDTFVSCLEQGRCRLVTHTQSVYFYQQLTVPGLQFTSRVRRALETYPALIVPLHEIPGAILRERRHYLVWHWPRELVYFSTDGNKGCNFYLVGSPFAELETFPVRKNSSLLRSLDDMAYKFVENQIHYNTRGKYFRTDHCAGQGRGGGEVDDAGAAGGTQLRSMLTAVYFYMLGIVIAVGVLKVEGLLGIRRRRRTDE